LTLLFASVSVIWQFPSDDRAVRNVLLDIAKAASYVDETPRVLGARLETILSSHLSYPLPLELAEVGPGNYSRDELLAGYLAYVREFRRVELRLALVEIEWSPKHDRATLRANLEVIFERPSGSRHVEPRKLRCAIERRGDTWRVAYAQITAKRVDEPEARP
jgi:hypothetical protein